MRYLFPLILLFSIAGFTQADDKMRQLPSGAATVQILGQTYYKSGDTFYSFQEDGGYFYEVQPPSVMPGYKQPQHQSSRTITVPGASADQLEGCRDSAADKSNANPQAGSQVYINEYNRCVGLLNQ